MNKTVLTLLLLLFSINSKAQESSFLDVFLPEDSSTLTDTSTDDFYTFIENKLKKYKAVEITVETFPNTSRNLSKERIAVIKDILNFNGLKIKKIVYYTEMKHLYFDEASISNWNFLRVKFNNQKSIDKLIHLNSNPSNFVDFNEIEENEITNDQPISLLLGKGTIIDIPENCFANELGELVTGKIKIETLEIFDVEDAIFNNVTTNIGDQFLESRGMVKIEAFDKVGNKLKLLPGKNISISIPILENSVEDNFKVYNGQLREGVYDWILNDTELETTEKIKSRRFRWEKISEEEQNEIKKEREFIIASWKEKGISSKSIRKRLKRFRKNFKRRHKRGKNKSSIYTKSNRDYEKLSRSMILGKANRRWHIDTTSNTSMFLYYKFKSFNLGMFNIDRVYKSKKPRNDIYVANKEEKEIKIFFKDEFLLIRGEQKNGKTLFKNIPDDKKIIMISTSKNENNLIELGFLLTQSGKKVYKIDNFKNYSIQDYKNKIKEITLRK